MIAVKFQEFCNSAVSSIFKTINIYYFLLASLHLIMEASSKIYGTIESEANDFMLLNCSFRRMKNAIVARKQMRCIMTFVKIQIKKRLTKKSRQKCLNFDCISTKVFAEIFANNLRGPKHIYHFIKVFEKSGLASNSYWGPKYTLKTYFSMKPAKKIFRLLGGKIVFEFWPLRH